MEINKKWWLTLPVMAALVLSGCGSETATEAATSSPVATTASAAPSAPAEVAPSPEPSQSTEVAAPVQSDALTALNALNEADEQAGGSYDRDLFEHWTKSNPTGCDTRFAVLVEESTVSAQTSGCKVVSGNWVSLYDGMTITVAGELDIDHMVPLKEAWVSGAHSWDAGTREAFANDLTYPESLIAVSASSNRSKSDQDPAEWMPPAANTHCTYAANWVSVKTRWNLAVDSAEKVALTQVLSGCAGATIDAVDKPVIGEGPAPAVEAPAPVAPAPGGATDPQFKSCKEAIANGYGPYVKGQTEYDWYRDGDGDGTVCEK